MLLSRFNWTLDQRHQDLEEFEQSLEIDRGPRPLGLQPVFELAQIAGLFRAVRTRLGDLAFDGGPLAIEVFELSGGLSLASGLPMALLSADLTTQRVLKEIGVPQPAFTLKPAVA